MAMSYIDQAAVAGHSEAARRVAVLGMETGLSISDFQYYLSISAPGGDAKAQELLDQSIATIGDQRTPSQIARAGELASDYGVKRCSR